MIVTVNVVKLAYDWVIMFPLCQSDQNQNARICWHVWQVFIFIYLFKCIQNWRKSSNIQTNILCVCSFLWSNLTFSFICWFTNVMVISTTQTSLVQLKNKYSKKYVSLSTTLRDYVKLMPSGTCFRSSAFKTNRKKFAFIPEAIGLVNSHSMRNGQFVLCMAWYLHLKILLASYGLAAVINPRVFQLWTLLCLYFVLLPVLWFANSLASNCPSTDE